MADIRIYSTEEAVGLNHPTKADVIKRPMLVAHDASGHHSTVDFPCLMINMNGTNQPVSTGTTSLKWSTGGGVEYNSGFTITSTNFKCPSTGVYLVNVLIRTVENTTSGESDLMLKRNTTILARGMWHKVYQNNINMSVSLMHLALCESTDDVFCVDYYRSVSTNTILSSEIGITRMEVCKICP